MIKTIRLIDVFNLTLLVFISVFMIIIFVLHERGINRRNHNREIAYELTNKDYILAKNDYIKEKAKELSAVKDSLEKAKTNHNWEESMRLLNIFYEIKKDIDEEKAYELMTKCHLRTTLKSHTNKSVVPIKQQD